MTPRQNKKDAVECPVCGGLIWGRGQKVIIEGAKMTVCDSCAQYGKKIPCKTKTSFSGKTSYSKGKTQSRKPTRKYDRFKIELELVPDYAKRIRKARNRLNLNQEKFAQKLHEKASLIRRIESGKAKPTIELAKKMEKTYNITLLHKPEEAEINYKHHLKKAEGGSWLRDIASIKKKKE